MDDTGNRKTYNNVVVGQVLLPGSVQQGSTMILNESSQKIDKEVTVGLKKVFSPKDVPTMLDLVKNK